MIDKDLKIIGAASFSIETVPAFSDSYVATGKILLRDYVNATIGFEGLGAALHKSPKSLMRMLSATGNPRADNLFAAIAHLKGREGVSVSLKAMDGSD